MPVDDTALLWWYGLSEEKRTDLELYCANAGLHLETYIYLCSGQGERLHQSFAAGADKASKSIGLFADACIDAGLWGFNDD